MKQQCRSILAIFVSLVSAAAFAQGVKIPAKPSDPMNPPAGEKPEVIGAITQPRVSFVSPKDGETVKPEFTVRFTVDGMTVRKADAVVPGTGHHHLIINGGPIAKGQVVPKDDKHLHFGDGSAETKLKLAPGDYTLTLQFADGAHMSYGEDMSQTIKIKVKK